MSKLDISIYFKFLSSKNICAISKSSEDIKFDKFNVVSDFKLESILFIFLSLAVLNDDKSNDCKFSHPENIPIILVT